MDFVIFSEDLEDVITVDAIVLLHHSNFESSSNFSRYKTFIQKLNGDLKNRLVSPASSVGRALWTGNWRLAVVCCPRYLCRRNRTLSLWIIR